MPTVCSAFFLVLPSQSPTIVTDLLGHTAAPRSLGGRRPCLAQVCPAQILPLNTPDGQALFFR